VIAVDRLSDAACWHEAELAIDDALTLMPANSAMLDTKATVWFRQGRVEEAIDLERAAAVLRPEPILFSQLDRFIGARARSYGSTGEVTLERDGSETVVKIGDGFVDGGTIFARADSDAGRVGLLRLSFSRAHAAEYRLPLDAPNTRFTVVLKDGRDASEQMTWRYALHDATVDDYP
jgi:hypothetical protein